MFFVNIGRKVNFFLKILFTFFITCVFLSHGKTDPHISFAKSRLEESIKIISDFKNKQIKNDGTDKGDICLPDFQQKEIFLKENNCCVQQNNGDIFKNNNTKKFKIEKNDDLSLVVCVSFSLPDVTLKGFFKTLPYHSNVRIVIRGLIDDSFVKTAHAIKEKEGVLDIDPLFFEKFNIDRVPAFVVFEKGEAKAKVFGNMTIEGAFSLFKQKGVIS